MDRDELKGFKLEDFDIRNFKMDVKGRERIIFNKSGSIDKLIRRYKDVKTVDRL
jgi:hypothetical protein